MHTLVTGGAGFIGSNLAEQLLKEDHPVTVLDNLNSYYNLNLKQYNLDTCRKQTEDSYEFVEGSIKDEALVHDLITSRDIDVIFHKAGKAGVRPSVEQPKEYNANNVGGLLTVLDAAADHELNGTYNLGAGEAYNFDTVVKLINKELRTDVEPVYVENPIPNDVYVHDTCADASTFTDATGWEPQIDFEEGISRVCEPYQ